MAFLRIRKARWQKEGARHNRQPNTDGKGRRYKMIENEYKRKGRKEPLLRNNKKEKEGECESEEEGAPDKSGATREGGRGVVSLPHCIFLAFNSTQF